MKLCPKCSTTKPLDEFHKSSTNPSGRAGYCKECISAYGKNKYAPRRPKMQVTNSHRECNTCRILKPHDEFTPKHRICKTCYLNKTRIAKYGISNDDYQAILDNQSGGCAICHIAESQGYNTIALDVDHDHATGQIRGLLCRKCNTALGLFNDNPDTLIAAAKYLTTNCHAGWAG